MLKPVALLARHMDSGGGAPRRIAKAEIPKDGSELGRLLRTFNTMTGAIEARAEAERRLAERERFVSLGRLSSSLAHEINNPLGGLLNAADTLRCFPDRPEVVRRSADLMERGLRHLGEVSRAILDENRLDRSGQALSAADFEDLHLLFEPEAVRKQQHVDWEVAADDRCLSRVSAAPVRQIVLNLLLNASAATPRGGQVGLRVTSCPAGIGIEVSDSGPGLTAADRDRLMSSAPIPPGGGVGLRLVHDIVTELGGSIGLERVEGQTVISVDLPTGEAAGC